MPHGFHLLRLPRGVLRFLKFLRRRFSAVFRWPPIEDGMMKLSAAQLSALLEGGEWVRTERREVVRPSVTQ